MSALVELLYRLNAGDEQTRMLDPRLLQVILNEASVQHVPALYTVPTDKALILNAATVQADPGAGQACTQLAMGLFSATAGLYYRFAQQFFVVAANVTQTLNWSGQMIVPGGTIIVLSAIYDAGVAANITQADGVGILIPRGNVERL